MVISIMCIVMTRTGSNYDFLFEYVLEFLQSAKWTGPINTFVDENCIVFDAEEDHKLSFTQVHNVCAKLLSLFEPLLCA